MATMNFTAKNLANIRKEMNTEFRGWNHCVKFVESKWDLLDAIGSVDGLLPEHLNAAWIIEQLNGTNDCKEGVLGHTVKGEFKARTMWTPGIVLDYLRKATRANWKRNNEALKANKA